MGYGTKEAQIAATVKSFWAKVDRTGDCWVWLGAKSQEGYGYFGRGELFPRIAHRMSYTLATGYRPNSDEYILHSCDNPSCVRPAHLRIGSAKDNYEDARARGRNTSGDRHGMWGGAAAVRGEAQGSSKLTEVEVRCIHAVKDGGGSLYRLAKDLGVSYCTVKRIGNRSAWRHVV